MGAGNFFSGLLSGYAGTVANQEERAYKQHIAARTFDVQTAIKAMDDAVKTGDQTAIQAASANLNRAMQGLETPFDYHRGKGKKGGKGQQGGMNPIAQAAIAGATQSALQNKPVAPVAGPMSEQIQSGPQAGQPAQSVGIQRPQLPPVPMMGTQGQPQAAAPKPAPAAQTPPIPAPPASLESVYQSPAFRPENQAISIGKANVAGIDAEVESASKWLGQQGINVTPQDKAEMQAHMLGIVPKTTMGHVLTGSFTLGNKLPPDATDPEGVPIPEAMRTGDSAFGTWIGPDGKSHYFSVKPPTMTTGAAAITVKSQNGVPVSVGNKTQSYPINDPNMPPQFKAIAQQALAGHQQYLKEQKEREALLNRMMMNRAMYSATSVNDQKQARNMLRKDVTSYQEAQRRLGIMEKNLPEALKGNQQAMVAILYNHVGMTALAQRGARQTRALIEEAENSRPWLQGIMARINGGEPLTGIALSPEQMQFMVQLAHEVDDNMREGVTSDAKEMFGDKWQNTLKQMAPGLVPDTVEVRLKSGQRGVIPKSALKQFKKDHPDATVVQ